MLDSGALTLDSCSVKSEKRLLSLFDVLCLGFNAIVGSGIYLFPGKLALQLGPASVLAFALCGVMSILIGLCFVEVSGMFDSSGGPYVYARTAFGDVIGYLVGWTCWAAAILSWAAVTSAIARDLGTNFFGHSASPQLFGLLSAIALTCVLGWINYRGVKPGAYTLDVLTVIKLLPLLVLVVVGLRNIKPALIRTFAPHGLGALPRASYLAFFAFQGFEVVPVPAGETDNPRRNAPLAVLGSIVGATTLYMAVQWAAVASTPGLPGSTQPLAIMGSELLGPLGGELVAGAGLISMLGFCAGIALSGPRYVEALAADQHLPSWIASRHPRHQTPARAIVVTTGLTLLLVLLIDFEGLVDLAVLTVGVQYLATCMAVPVLRWSLPHQQRRFRLPLGPVIPIAATAITIWFGMQAELEMLLWFGVMLLAGVPLKVVGEIFKRKNEGEENRKS